MTLFGDALELLEPLFLHSGAGSAPGLFCYYHSWFPIGLELYMDDDGIVLFEDGEESALFHLSDAQSVWEEVAPRLGL